MTIEYIYWLGYYNNSCPSIRYRGKYVLDELKTHYGIGNSMVTPGYGLRTIFHFVNTYFSVLFNRRKNSLIVFQKICSKGIYAILLKFLLLFHRKNTIYDLDDAEYLRFSPETLHFFLSKCKACTVGSYALEEYAMKYNRNVRLLTSPVIYHQYIKSRRNEVFTLGWVGFYNTKKKASMKFSYKKTLTELVFPAIKKITFKCKLILLGVSQESDRIALTDLFCNYPNILIEMPDPIDWENENSIYDRIKEFDAGLAPLLDCEMHRAKSAFKLKQYLSCGVPVLANDIGENCRFLMHEVNGYICNTPEEFYLAILKLKNLSDHDFDLLSKNAKRLFEEFSIEKYGMTFYKYFCHN